MVKRVLTEAGFDVTSMEGLSVNDLAPDDIVAKLLSIKDDVPQYKGDV